MAIVDADYKDIKPKPDLFERKWFRMVLLGGIPALVFVLVSAGIRVSQYGIDHTVLVYGDKVLVAHRPAAIRVSLMADDGRFFLPEELTGYLSRGGARHMLFGGPVSDRGQALGRDFKVPKLEPGQYELELDIRFDKRRRTVHAPVTLVERPPEESPTVPEDTKLETPIPMVMKDDIELQALTEDRGAPTGITSVLFLRSLDKDGAPVSLPIDLTVAGRDGAISERTDRLGLIGIPVKPLELALPVQVKGARKKTADPSPDASAQDTAAGKTADAGPLEDAYLYPHVVHSGVSATVETPMVQNGNPVTITIEQVSNGGPLYVDLFRDGRFVKAASGWLSGQRAEIDVKPDFPGLYRLQLSTTPFSADRGVAVRHFYVLDEGETRIDGLKAILRKLRHTERDGAWADAVLRMPLETGSGFKPGLAAAFALSRLYKGHRPPPNLVSSRLEDDRELNAFKAKFQRMVMLAIIALGLGVSLLIGSLALSAHLRQQRLTAMILDESDGAGDDDMPPSASGLRNSSLRVIQGVVLLLIILGAFVSIALLVDTLSWRS